MDPSSIQERITVKALYDYTAKDPKELTFCKHAIIANVKKTYESWWIGDYGGQKQLFFPADYVRVLDNSDSSGGDQMLLGSLQKGSLDVHGAVVEFHLCNESQPGEPEWFLQIHNPSMQNAFKVGVKDRQEASDWKNAIHDAAQNASVLENERRIAERNARVAAEISDLIIYFRSIPFVKNINWHFYEMSSFPETKAEKLFLQQDTRVI